MICGARWYLNERQRRLLLAAEAGALGHGGITAVARLAEVSESTVVRGRAELAGGAAGAGTGAPCRWTDVDLGAAQQVVLDADVAEAGLPCGAELLGLARDALLRYTS